MTRAELDALCRKLRSFAADAWIGALAADACGEAAARIDGLRKALDPFARAWRLIAPLAPVLSQGARDVLPGAWPTVADLQAADKALAMEPLGLQRPSTEDAASLTAAGTRGSTSDMQKLQRIVDDIEGPPGSLKAMRRYEQGVGRVGDVLHTKSDDPPSSTRLAMLEQVFEAACDWRLREWIPAPNLPLCAAVNKEALMILLNTIDALDKEAADGQSR